MRYALCVAGMVEYYCVGHFMFFKDVDVLLDHYVNETTFTDFTVVEL